MHIPFFLIYLTSSQAKGISLGENNNYLLTYGTNSVATSGFVTILSSHIYIIVSSLNIKKSILLFE